MPKSLPTLLVIITSSLTCCAKAQDLHPLEPATKHYQSLQGLSATNNALRSALNAIEYPLSDGTGGSNYIGIDPTYLTNQQVEELKNSLKFPANSSDQTRAELDFLLQWEMKRTASQKERVLEIARIGYWPPLGENSASLGRNVDHLFWECREVTGEDCPTDQYPATLKLLAGVTRDMRIMEFTVKYYLLRARPYHLEPKLNPMARISSPSYASGHTLWAYIQAFTWSELMPERRQQFLDIAYEVGESREIMGIHYPSDEEAARILAHRMLEFMWHNPEFQGDLKAAKAEWL